MIAILSYAAASIWQPLLATGFPFASPLRNRERFHCAHIHNRRGDGAHKHWTQTHTKTRARTSHTNQSNSFLANETQHATWALVLCFFFLRGQFRDGSVPEPPSPVLRRTLSLTHTVVAGFVGPNCSPSSSEIMLLFSHRVLVSSFTFSTHRCCLSGNGDDGDERLCWLASGCWGSWGSFSGALRGGARVEGQSEAFSVF